MKEIRCRGCGCHLDGGDVHYKARVDLCAAYDRMEITREDLDRDPSEEIRQLLMKMADEDSQELSDEVFMRLAFDLCKQCKERFAKQLERGEFFSGEDEV